jgi:hypothetical protein
MILVAILISGCSNEGPNTGDDVMLPDAADGSNDSSGSHPDGAGPDATSYAPCDTCCDPIAQDCASPSDACYLAADFKTTYCAPSGPRTEGMSCTGDSDCIEDTTCTGKIRCDKFCRTGADCASGQCLAANVSPEHNSFGVCN